VNLIIEKILCSVDIGCDFEYQTILNYVIQIDTASDIFKRSQLLHKTNRIRMFMTV
jgi:hypothetical protein